MFYWIPLCHLCLYLFHCTIHNDNSMAKTSKHHYKSMSHDVGHKNNSSLLPISHNHSHISPPNSDATPRPPIIFLFIILTTAKWLKMRNTAVHSSCFFVISIQSDVTQQYAFSCHCTRLSLSVLSVVSWMQKVPAPPDVCQVLHIHTGIQIKPPGFEVVRARNYRCFFAV